MKHHCTLFLCVLVTIAGCKKKDPDVPALSGRWDWVQSTTTHYNSSGSILGTDAITSTSSGAMYLAISADSINQHQAQTGIFHQGYSRSGNVLSITPKDSRRYPPYSWTIMELTEHRLLVRFENYYSGSGKLADQADSEYSR